MGIIAADGPEITSTAGGGPTSATATRPTTHLHANHLADLEASGIDETTAAAAGIYSEHDRRKLSSLLNTNYSVTARSGPTRQSGSIVGICELR